MNKLLLAMGAALATAAATAANVAFTGSDGGNYSSAANWTTEGSPDEHRLPGASDTAVIPDNTTVKVVSAEDVAALVGTGKLNLNGANAKVVALDAADGFKLDANAELLGTGLFAVSNTVAGTTRTVEIARKNPNFKGRFNFYGTAVKISDPLALGISNRVDYTMAYADARKFYITKAGDYHVDLRLKRQSSDYWWGFEYNGSGDCFLYGRVEVLSWMRLVGSSGHLVITKDCEFVTNGNTVDYNGKVRVLGTDKIYQASNYEGFYSDSGSFTGGDYIYIERSIAGYLTFNKSAIQLGKTDQLVVNGETATVRIGNGAGCYGKLDLNGYTQNFWTFNFEAVSFNAVGSSSGYATYPHNDYGLVLTSERAPATANFWNTPGGGKVFHGSIDGKLTVRLDGDGKTFAVSNCFPYVTATQTWGTERLASNTSGGLWARQGTITVKEARFPKLTLLRAGAADASAAAKIVIASPEAEINPYVQAKVEGVGQIEIAAGVTLTVLTAENADGAIAAGTYTGSLPSGFTGEGTLKVSYDAANLKLFTGGSGASLSEPANWSPEGVPTSGQNVMFPEGDYVATATEYAYVRDAASVIFVNADLKVQGANETMTFATPLKGVGSFSIASSVGNESKYLDLTGNNGEFVGTLTFSNYFVRVKNKQALTKVTPLVIWGPSISDNKGYALQYVTASASGVYENPLEVHNGASWWTINADNCAVTNKGDFTFFAPSGYLTRLLGTGTNGYLAFQGKVLGRSGNLLLGGKVEFSGDDPIVLPSKSSALYCDDSSAVIRLGKKMASYSYLNSSLNGYLNLQAGRWIQTVSNVTKNARLVVGNASYSMTYDLNGQDAEFGHHVNGWEDNYRVEYKNANTTVMSTNGPALLKFTSIVYSDNRIVNSKFNGDLSLGIDMYDYGVWDSTWYVTLSNREGESSTMTGRLEPTTGTFRLTSATRMPNLSRINILQNGSIWVQSTPQINRKVEIDFPAKVRDSGQSGGYDGVLAINEGASLTVKVARTNGVEIAPGVYTMANLPYIKGASKTATKSGQLIVRGTGLAIIVR